MDIFGFSINKKNKKRSFQGASRKKRLSRWNATARDADATSKSDLSTLRNRARDLRRNNPLARKAIDVITANVVGKGISTQVSIDSIKTLWKEWAETTACDFDGRNSLKGLQRLAMDAVVESGEVLIRTRIVAGHRFPLQYQVLEADFLDSTKTQANFDGNTVLQGIEIDKSGKRVGYHLYENHPGSIDSRLSLDSNFIPISEVKHIYRQDRPGQLRGITWLAPIMVRIKDLDEFEDAQLMRQKIASCFTAFVHDLGPDVDCTVGPDEEDPADDLGARIEPGIIEFLPVGKTVSFANPPGVENYREFVNSQIRTAAAGIGLSFESLSGDLSETNYSSGRMGWIEMGRNIDSWRQHILIRHFMDPAVDDFIFMLSLLGITATKDMFKHVSPRREMIDPVKEVPALIDSIRGGLQSRSAAIMSMGDDPDRVHNEIEQDNKKADEKGLILDSDPRYTNKTGKKQEVANEESNQDTAE